MREIGIILIASFAIDRIVTGLFFLLSMNDDLRTILEPEAISNPEQKARATKVYRLVYAIVAGYLGTVIFAGQLGIRLSAITGLSPDTRSNPIFSGWLDILLTGLLLSGGADRLAEGLKMFSEGGKKESRGPVEFTGKVVVEQSPGGSHRD